MVTFRLALRLKVFQYILVRSLFSSDLNRVCRAWHRTSGVQVPVPGIIGAEG